MKKNLLIFTICILIVTGCASTQEPALYILSAPESVPASEKTGGVDNSLTLFIAPIKIPAYLNRPLIVTQTDKNQLVVSDFHRWAAPLEKNLRQTLARSLSLQLNSNRICADGRRPPDKTDFQIEITVLQLNGILGKTAELEARWSIQSPQSELAAVNPFRKSVSLTDETRLCYVQAQSELLNQLSLDIARTIRKIITQQKG